MIIHLNIIYRELNIFIYFNILQIYYNFYIVKRIKFEIQLLTNNLKQRELNLELNTKEKKQKIIIVLFYEAGRSAHVHAFSFM